MFEEACPQIISAIHHISQEHNSPIVVALDGRSGAGKSTLAHMLEGQIDCVVVQLDDFFAANIPDHKWDKRSAEEKIRDVFDWQRVRTEALEPLIAGQTARWHPFDFAAGLRSDGTYGMSEQWIKKGPGPVIILEGAYSSSAPLSDLVNLKVLLDVPVTERHRRLDAREPDKQFLKRWHFLWDEAEDYYFTEVMPASLFDLVISGV